MTHYIQNKSPSAAALGDWFSEILLLTSEASPNRWLAIIIIIIIVGEAKVLFHELAYYSTGFGEWGDEFACSASSEQFCPVPPMFLGFIKSYISSVVGAVGAFLCLDF